MASSENVVVSKVAFLVFMFCGSIAFAQVAPPADNTIEKVEWEKLEFDDSRRLTKARVVVTEPLLFNDPEVIVTDVTVESPKVLKLLESAIAGAHIPVPKKAGGYAGALPSMRLELTTSKDSFKIQAFEASFALSERATSYDSHRSFHSAPLTVVLDALLRRETGQGLTEEQFSGLSGELAIISSVKRYKKLLAETKEFSE